MIIQDKIKKLLEENNCEFEMFEHEPVRTSEEAATTRSGISIHQGAKALVCGAKLRDGNIRHVMIVIPADMRANLKSVRKHINARDLTLISPSDMLQLTGVEVGGVPPFGNLFGFDTYFDNGILRNERIAFNAGDRTISVIMKSEDLVKLVKPVLGDWVK